MEHGHGPSPDAGLTAAEAEAAEIDIKYEGFITRQVSADCTSFMRVSFDSFMSQQSEVHHQVDSTDGSRCQLEVLLLPCNICVSGAGAHDSSLNEAGP